MKPSTSSLSLFLVGLAACSGANKGSPQGPGGGGGRVYDALPRMDFNRLAVRLDLPLYWIADANGDGRVQPDEVATLLFYGSEPRWTAGGAFTSEFASAYDRMLALRSSTALAGQPADETRRRELVDQDLDQGRATLVLSDLRALSPADKAFVGHMLVVAHGIDALYDQQTGAAALAAAVPADDLASQSLFRRNHGPACVAPATEKEPGCSAIPGAPKPVVGVYPAELQGDHAFCEALEHRPDAKKLLSPFTVVRGSGGKLEAVPYNQAYPEEMSGVAAELDAAADAIDDPNEAPLVAYLHAAAASFRSNDWLPADEAWARMNAENSKWYVRVGPDEVYWEPCAHKAGFHLTFALINQGSLAWQRKLVPVQQEMEAAVAATAGPPYKARNVAFHLPDFIDIVVNAGDDRNPTGATVGQSLPNWGPVADGRGRTVAMSNLYTDPDSLASRRAQAQSLLDGATAAAFVDSAEPGLLATILHEATHNLGPAHEYAVAGKVDDQLFGGGMASVLEELKAQTGGLFLVDLLRGKGLISDELAAETYVDSIVWAFGHIAQGQYTATGERKAYSNLSAIQIGFLMDHGAITWDPNAAAANGTDKGAFVIHTDKLVGAVAEMMKVVAGIKARGDKAAADALAAKYVDGPTVPQAIIAERVQRFPKASFVYAILM